MLSTKASSELHLYLRELWAFAAGDISSCVWAAPWARMASRSPRASVWVRSVTGQNGS